MVNKRRRSRTLRRVYKKLPGGTTRIFYLKRKPSKPKCGNCGVVLKGMVRERPPKMRNIAKSKKVPSRPFRGNLCSKCTRLTLKERIRSQNV